MNIRDYYYSVKRYHESYNKVKSEKPENFKKLEEVIGDQPL